MRLIDADVLQAKFEKLRETDTQATGVNAYDLCAMLAEDAPTIEASPVVHGEWIYEYHTWHCNVCGCHPYKGYIPKEPSNFCPNCGARMDRKENLC